MWYNGPCGPSVLAAAFVHPRDTSTGWRSHIDPPEETNRGDSGILEKQGQPQHAAVTFRFDVL